VDSQVPQAKVLVNRILLMVAAVILVVSLLILGWYLNRISDPYIQQVLSLRGDRLRGHEIFEINCAGCHGKEADGLVGPSLHNVSKRKSRVSLVEQVISGRTPPMPKFQPSIQEMADLLIYLENLS
jgi:mono/diheme cytochrome c family protein